MILFEDARQKKYALDHNLTYDEKENHDHTWLGTALVIMDVALVCGFSYFTYKTTIA